LHSASAHVLLQAFGKVLCKVWLYIDAADHLALLHWLLGLLHELLGHALAAQDGQFFGVLLLDEWIGHD